LESYITIKGRRVGRGNPVYSVAELSANHHQNFEQAVRLVRAAKEASADAIKLQAYTPNTLTIDASTEWFRIGRGTPWEGRSLHDLYDETYMPWEWIPRLKKLACDSDLDMFSTAYDESSVDFLEELGVPVHKVASYELVDLPLVEKMARSGKPLILSTGMASLGEIEEAVQTARNAGAGQIALLKCTSAYPAPLEEMNLMTIPHLACAFNVPVGLSDHSLNVAVPSAAVALGACIIEKHLTLSRSVKGPDSDYSLEPFEFKTMVEAVRATEKALGKIHYGMTSQEAQSIVFRRSLFVVKDMKLGETFTKENVRSIRPGYGLPPKYLKDVLGRTAARDIAGGTPLDWRLVA
jgi:N-acetylneuraminate synthase